MGQLDVSVRAAVDSDFNSINRVAFLAWEEDPVIDFQAPNSLNYVDDYRTLISRIASRALHSPTGLTFVAETVPTTDYQAPKMAGFCSMERMVVKEGRYNTREAKLAAQRSVERQWKQLQDHFKLFEVSRHRTAAFRYTEEAQYHNMTVKRGLTSWWWISCLATDPEYKGQGVAVRILEWFCTIADFGDQWIGVSCCPEAAPLYKYLGFKVYKVYTVQIKGDFEEQQVVVLHRRPTARKPRAPTIGGVSLLE
ncbi:hypothetical protein B0T17DRAFT_371815 [Bombardia bombarda]|uniref:N-acetyltransferase domain-containing protein n=1 Tax=Bombardia bombarda TaxID=252184 RepID=A0AA39WGE9_9PEZI|nr:hypothetical protein B0T17DRAFT_371815 [Bombardia bombarda]